MSILTQMKTAVPGQTVYDVGEKGSVTGLHLRVSMGKRGVHKRFFLYYETKDGTRRRPKLGEFPEINLTEARRRARILMDQVAVGLDPRGKWLAQREELTVAELFNQTWDQHWSDDRYIKSGWAKEAKRLYEKNIAPSFGNTRVSVLTDMEIDSWHNSFKSSPYTGNRSLEVLSKMFNFGIKKKLIAGTNPCLLVDAHVEVKRKRYATVEELKRICTILHRESTNHPRQVAFIYLLMFTGSRPRAIERATWAQLSLMGTGVGLLSFKGKGSEDSGEEETVVIPQQAMRLIAKLEHNAKGTITGIKMPHKFWNQIRKEAGCPDLWARDLRRTFATVGLSSGVSSGVLSELLNHKSTQTTKTYAKLIPSEKIEAACEIASKLEELISTDLIAS